MNLQDLQAELRQDPEYVQAENNLRFNFRLSKAVLYARMAKGWSQTELARRVNTKQANISRIEASIANPTLDLIRRLCDVLDIDLNFTGPTVVVTYKAATTTADITEESIRVDDIVDNIFF